MRFQGVSDLEVGIPNFQSSVPSYRGEVRLEGYFRDSLQKRRISDTWNPISVVIGLTGEFVIGKCVPQFDSFVGSSWNDLSVVRGESNGEDFLGVSEELSGNLTGS